MTTPPEETVKRYEWVRGGMACVDSNDKTIPWCAREYFVLATAYADIAIERDRLLNSVREYTDICEAYCTDVDRLRQRVAALQHDVDEARVLLQHAQYIAESDLCAVGHAPESRARTESMEGLRKWIAQLEVFLSRTLNALSGEK